MSAAASGVTRGGMPVSWIFCRNVHLSKPLSCGPANTVGSLLQRIAHRGLVRILEELARDVRRVHGPKTLLGRAAQYLGEIRSRSAAGFATRAFRSITIAQRMR